MYQKLQRRFTGIYPMPHIASVFCKYPEEEISDKKGFKVLVMCGQGGALRRQLDFY